MIAAFALVALIGIASYYVLFRGTYHPNDLVSTKWPDRK
jgi:hypothetical protein